MQPVLLLHGALGSKAQLHPLQMALRVAGLDVYSMNLSGHGGQPFVEPFDIHSFADDVRAFIDTNKLKRVNIFGYSMGGYVAIWLAHKHPGVVDRIVTLGTKFDWSPASAARVVAKLDPEKILAKVPAFARILEHRHTPNDWKALIRKTSAMMTALGAAPILTEDVLSAIRNEILILLGDQDDMADMTFSVQVSETLPHCRFLLLPDTPHPIEKVDVETLQRIVVQEFR